MRINLFRDTGNIEQLTKDVQTAERDGFHGVWFGQNRGAEIVLEFGVAAHVPSGLFLLAGL